jgi:hypothetical protein
MPQMDVDIRKPVTHDFGIHRLEESSGSISEEDDSEDEEGAEIRQRTISTQSAISQNATQALQGASDLENQTVEAMDANGGYPIYESESDEEDEEEELAESERVGGWVYYSTLARHYVHKTSRGFWRAIKSLALHPNGSAVPRSNRQQLFFGDQPVYLQRFKALKGKKIHVPIRVEPKVYFAAERTFLGWVSRGPSIPTPPYVQGV